MFGRFLPGQVFTGTITLQMVSAGALSQSWWNCCCFLNSANWTMWTEAVLFCFENSSKTLCKFATSFEKQLNSGENFGFAQILSSVFWCFGWFREMDGCRLMVSFVFVLVLIFEFVFFCICICTVLSSLMVLLMVWWNGWLLTDG